MLSKSIPPIRLKTLLGDLRTRPLQNLLLPRRTTPLQKGYSQPPDLFWYLFVRRWLFVFPDLMFDLSSCESSFSNLSVRELGSVKRRKLFLELGLFGLLGLLLSHLGFHLGLHLGLLVLLLKLDLSRWKWRLLLRLLGLHLVLLLKLDLSLLLKLDLSRWKRRGLLDYASKNGIRQCVHMMDGAQEIIANQAIFKITLMDSGSSYHCSGDESLLSASDYTEEKTDWCLNGVGGGKMKVYGSGSICNETFYVKGVKYVPGLNQSNIIKTVFSVSKLAEEGYYTNFDEASCTVTDKRSQVWSWTKWTWTNEIVGKGRKLMGLYHMDYLKVRDYPVSKSEGEGVVRWLWNAASLSWSTIKEGLQSHGAKDQRSTIKEGLQSHGAKDQRAPV